MSELAREQVAQHIELLSRHLTYPELDALHALDEADATLRVTIQEQTERIKALELLDHRWTRAEINELEQEVAQLREVLSRAMSLGAKICYAEPELSEYRDLREAARQLLTPVPYPGWCRHPDQCQGKSSCPDDPTCAD